MRAHPSTAMSCVAQRKTRKNHHHVNDRTPDPSLAPAATIISLTLPPRYIMPIPEHTWIGIIQLFLLPSLGLHTASTIGLHSSFNEYGYDANVKTPICPYERCCFRRKGTDPDANPMGIPCRKYRSTKSRKFRLSCRGRSKKLEFGFGVMGVCGGSVSSVKLSLLIRWAVCEAADGDSRERCFRRISR